MSLKQELVQWNEAAKAYEAGDYEGAIDLFEPIADSSKIHFNLGMIFQSLGQHEEAILAFNDSVTCDMYLSVAYFQMGVSLYILQDFEQALTAFDNAFLYFRGTFAIDYTQLGLEYKLYSCEVQYNRALTFFQLDDEQAAMQDLAMANKGKAIPEHEVINEAIQYRGDGCQLFQVPANLIYKPAKHKIENAKKVDYLGRSKVVATTDASDNFIEFKGARGIKPEAEPDFTPIRTLQRKNSAPNIMPARIDTIGRRPSAPMLTPPVSAGGGTYGRSRGGQDMTPPPPPPAPMRGGRDPRDRERDMAPPSPMRGPAMRTPTPPPIPAAVRGGSGSGGGYADSDTYSLSRASIAQGRLRVKVQFGDKRMLLLPLDATFDELCDKIAEKFNADQFRVLFRDEDGELVSMTDDDDLLLCRSIAPDENKIEVICE
ncbi:hypothetical protein BC828DRAFT_387239 [Blastocladiella britannica]|nr:hypothetical protein BC828DRAFT_387239 [Blastocladiella britannica]